MVQKVQKISRPLKLEQAIGWTGQRNIGFASPSNKGFDIKAPFEMNVDFRFRRCAEKFGID
ncbi:hypothetical protein ATY78_25925 [Rhizobium sp. R635]|nr:hypothetical protein ATY78_25925 [Rhizobium sp. R635]